MELESENCGRCGGIVYPFSKKESASDSAYYCVKCAEELDREYLKKNVCSLCTELIPKGDVKFVMPSRIYSSYFFDRLPLENRLMCLDCYRKVEKMNIIRNPLTKLIHIRARLQNAFRKEHVLSISSGK
jgi:hypothetical protein